MNWAKDFTVIILYTVIILGYYGVAKYFVENSNRPDNFRLTSPLPFWLHHYENNSRRQHFANNVARHFTTLLHGNMPEKLISTHLCLLTQGPISTLRFVECLGRIQLYNSIQTLLDAQLYIYIYIYIYITVKQVFFLGRGVFSPPTFFQEASLILLKTSKN